MLAEQVQAPPGLLLRFEENQAHSCLMGAKMVSTGPAACGAG